MGRDGQTITATEFAAMTGVSRERQVFRAARGEVIEDADTHAVPEQPLDDVRSDEPGTAGHETQRHAGIIASRAGRPAR